MKEIEIIEKRKEREKHFLKSNGEITAILYNEDIHFLKDGKYQEIDNTLILEDNYYTNTNNSYKVWFGKNPKEDLMQMETLKHYINIKVKEVGDFTLKKEINNSKLVSNISYLNILKDIDLDYSILSNKVKESIILKNKDIEIDKLTFSIETNLELKENIDKSISAIDNGKVIFNIDAPYMIDQNKSINNNVYYDLKKVENEYLLKLIVDKNWLNDENTKYPIVIDPTITNSNQDNSVYDTYIYPGDTGVDKNSKAYLKVGVEKINETNITNRALLKFELPVIGTGSQIIDAQINLRGYPDYTNTHQSTLINIHRMTSDWNETDAAWDSLNDKYDSRVEGTIQSTRSYYDTDDGTILYLSGTEITSLVKKWYADTPNYGIMLKENNEVYINDAIPMFFSKDNNVTGYNPKPLLIVTYRNQNGLESYMDYQTQSFSHGKAYHNNYNGNLTTIFDVGSTISGKLPASLKLVYNTNDVVLNNNIGYGLGYRFSLNQTIKQTTIDGITYLEYVDEDGTIHYFLNQKVKYDESDGFITTTYENTYFDEDGLDLVIEKSDTNYILKDKNNNEMTFIINNDIGYLSEIIDVSNNKILVTYDANHKITKVTDANEQEINITYEDNIISVISPDQTITLNYTNNNLTSIISLAGTTSFTYQNNLIASITDINGRKIAYEYYTQSPYRLKKVTEYGLNDTLGNYFEVLYDFNTTTIIDSKNKAKTITFNNYGNPISISNLKTRGDVTNAYGMKSEYGETSNGVNTYNNKLLSNEIPLKYVKNYLANTSFENDLITSYSSGGSYMEISSDYSNSGNNCLKINWVDYDPELEFRQVAVSKGKSYTFSAYIKTDAFPIQMILKYKDENEEIVSKSSENIISSEEFERNDITIYYPETATSDLIISFSSWYNSVSYIDDIQLEEGEVANNYNMLENSDFSDGLSGWTTSAIDWQTGNEISTDGIFEVVNITNNQKALKINMNPANSTNFSKSFKVLGKAGDTYSLSFWYKHEGFVGAETMGPVTYNNIIFNFEYNTPSETDEVYNKTFNPNESEWQYFSYSFTALRDFSSIKLNFLQSLNANSFYITNLNLFKDIRSVTYDYDESGNIILSKDLNNESSEFNYDKNNQLIGMTDPRGKNFTFEYDNVVTDRVLRGVSGTGISNEIKYDLFGNPITNRIINRGQAKEIGNNIYKIRLKGTEKCLRLINNSLVFEIDECGHDKWLLEQSEDNTYKIKHSIINNKYLASIDNNIVITSNQANNSLFVLTTNKNGSYLIQSKSNNKYLKHNDNSLILSELVEDDENFDFYFETIANKEFIENNAEYTSDGKYITSTVDTNFNKTTYDIDTITGLTKSVTNAKGQTTYYNYNDKRQLTSITNQDRSVNYEYNNQNCLSKIIQDDREYKFNYDEFLNTKSINIGDNITLITNNYEENNGNLLSSVYGNNHVISYDYDDFNRIKTLTKMNDTYHYKYGNNGDLIKIISNNDTIKYTYDLAKRLTQYKFNDFKIKYGYDSNDNIITKKYQLNDIEHTVENTLNDDDAITKEVIDNNEFNYNYDSLGRLINSNINNNYNTNYKYISNGNRTSLLIKSIDNNNDKYSYKYDKLNNITHIYHNEILENRYYYDEYNELIKEDNYLLNQTIRYKYDTLGNILSKKVYELNTYNQLEQNMYKYRQLEWKDQLIQFNDDIITYDEIGNPLTIGDNITLNWINGRQLNTYTDSNNTINYKYNKDGIRTSKIINNIETKYYLEGSNIILENTNTDMLYYLYNNIGDLIGFKYNNDSYYYIKNNQDDIIGILDNSYNIVAKYTYDSWGNIISITDGNNNDISLNNTHIANINPFRYRSYYYDKETKLYYLNSRYYNPLWGRFINADSYGGEVGGNILSHHVYAYALNNPITNCDIDGMYAAALTTGTLAAGVLAVAAIAVTYQVAKTVAEALPTITNSLSSRYYNPPKYNYKTKDEVKTKANTKAKAVTPYVQKSEEYKPCTTARLGGGDVIRGNRLTIDESINHVRMNNDVMCDTRVSAFQVASKFDDYYFDPPHRGGVKGYYPHYHPWDGYGHPHIWFYEM